MNTVSEEPGEREQAEHRERQAELEHHAEHDAEPGAEPDARGLAHLASMKQLAAQGADERTGEQPERPEEQTGKGSNERACDGEPAGTHALGPDRGGEQVHGTDVLGPDAEDWRLLGNVVREVAQQVAADLFPIKQPTLLVQLGLLARFELKDFLMDLVASAQTPQSAAVFLLVPGEAAGIPLINGTLAIPHVGLPNALMVPLEWLSKSAA